MIAGYIYQFIEQSIKDVIVCFSYCLINSCSAGGTKCPHFQRESCRRVALSSKYILCSPDDKSLSLSTEGASSAKGGGECLPGQSLYYGCFSGHLGRGPFIFICELCPLLHEKAEQRHCFYGTRKALTNGPVPCLCNVKQFSHSRDMAEKIALKNLKKRLMWKGYVRRQDTLSFLSHSAAFPRAKDGDLAII